MKPYFKHKLTNLLVVNDLVTVHYFEFKKDFFHGEEFHDFWEIVYLDKGRAVCYADKKEIRLSEGEILFHKPNEVHSLSCEGKYKPQVFIISFVCRSEAMRFFENKKILLESNYRRYFYRILEEAKRTFDIPYSDPETRKIELLKNPTLGGKQLIKNNLELLLIDLMRGLTETDGGNKIFLTENQFDKKIAAEIIEFLKERVYERVNIDDICYKISYSRAYVFKKFKSVTGKTVMEYYLQLKIMRAKELLSEGTLSVKEISEKLSFDTPNYFTKTFKKFCGYTPTEYRKKVILE